MQKKIKICICMIIVLSLGLVNYCFASTATVNTKTLNVRCEPYQTAQKLGVVKLGQKYEVLEKSGNWVKINFNDADAWICADYVNLDETEENTNDVEKEEIKNEDNEVKNFKKVTASVLNIRISASSSAKKIGIVKYGTEVEVLETINDWDRIVVNNLTGWVCNLYLKASNKEVVNSEEQDTNSSNTASDDEQIVVLKTAVVNTSTLNVRKDANTQSQKLGSLNKNAVVAIVGEENGWYKIKYNNQYGYISSEYTLNKDITISRGSYSRGEKPTTIAETATTLALQYVGCKYVWGGTSPNGFDCSGLVYYVYKDYVPNLGRSARPQAKTGTTIEKENLVMGDLVFFGENGGSTVTHVGIYVGDGIFVHAANSKRGVVTDTLLSGYYSKNFLHAKRIV